MKIAIQRPVPMELKYKCHFNRYWGGDIVMDIEFHGEAKSRMGAALSLATSSRLYLWSLAKCLT